MQLDRDGTMSVEFRDGRVVTAALGNSPFAPTSAILRTTVYVSTWQLHLRTVHNDDVYVELPAPDHRAPVSDRPTIYLDQNHWSTITLAVHYPERITNAAEFDAAARVIGLANAGEVILPMSAGHMSETCKQRDPTERYKRALTIAQLSRGWQLRDPLHLRHLELQSALAARYKRPQIAPPAAITLEPDALYSARDSELPPVGDDFPPLAQELLHAVRCAAGNIDTMLDGDFVPMPSNAGWAAGFQEFADFLRASPSSKELKRQRTLAKFVVDLGTELTSAAYAAGVSPESMTDWAITHSEHDLQNLPALGLHREVIHEKLSDPQMRWKENDLVDMMYLTSAAGYCTFVVAERSHASHIRNGLRRLGLATQIHPNLRSFSEALP